MSENMANHNLRTTSISLDEYDRLRDSNKTLLGTIGAFEKTIDHLTDKVEELQQKQPQVKIIHYTEKYSDWNDEQYLDTSKVEFVNLTEVETLANNKAKAEVESKISGLENEILDLRGQIKHDKDNRLVITEKIEDKERQIKKLEKRFKEELDDKATEYEKNTKKLKVAADEDSKQYKETIKELKEEIQKVKDSKTDVEIEEKRNKEIKDLKGRIKDLETMIQELGKLNIFKRIWKLRKFSNEALLVHEALLEREKNANNVGTTWVKENSRYRKYDSFKEAWQSLHNYITVTFSNGWMPW